MKKIIGLIAVLSCFAFYSKGQDLSECLSPNQHALDFDGTDDWIAVSNPLSGNANFTFEAWILSTATNNDFFRYLGMGGIDTRFELGDRNGALTLYHFTPSVGEREQSGSDIRDGQWHHIAVVRNGATAEVYLDGTLDFMVNNLPNNFNFNPNMRLGRWPGSTQSGLFKGKMDEVRYWNYPRLQDEIVATKDCPLEGNEEGLIFYYDFNQGTPNILNTNITMALDRSLNIINGELRNFGLEGIISNWVCSEVDLSKPYSCDNACEPSVSINFSTGWDASTNGLISDGQIDPLWRLMNLPPLSNLNGATILANPPIAYAVTNLTNSWNNTTGSKALSFNNTANFDFDNADIDQPWRFRRYFCICSEDQTEINLAGQIRADDGGKLTLYNSDGTTAGFSVSLDPPPNSANFNSGQNYNQNVVVQPGKYYFEFELINTNSVAAGFAIQGTLSNLNDQAVIADGFGECCSASVITGQKILDNNCNAMLDEDDELGEGFTFQLLSADGTLLETVTSDQFGEFTFNDVPNGSYIVQEVPQFGWNPIQSLIDVSIGTNDVQTVEFFNCPATSPCDSVTMQSDTLVCLEDNTVDAIFTITNNSSVPYEVIDFYDANADELLATIPVGLAPGDSYTYTHNIDLPLGSEFCLKAFVFNFDEGLCCHLEECVQTNGCVDCEEIAVESSPTSDDDPCCYDISLVNNDGDFFSQVTATITTPGITFSDVVPTGATVTGGNGTAMMIMDVSSSIPVGTTAAANFCLDGVIYDTQIPQEIIFDWYGKPNADGESIIVCSDTLYYECRNCAVVEDQNVECDNEGNPILTFNLIDFPEAPAANFVRIDVIEPSNYGFNADCAPYYKEVTPNTTTPFSLPIVECTGGALVAGTEIKYRIAIFNDTTGVCCILDTLSFIIPDCNMECIGEPNPDLICNTVIDPVCGCDRVTYNNACEAERAGILQWTNGECNKCPEDPINTLAWLSELAQGLEECCEGGNKMIEQCTLNGECVFIVPDCAVADGFTTIYDVEGNIICQAGGITGIICEEFELLEDCEVIWVCGSDCPTVDNPLRELEFLAPFVGDARIEIQECQWMGESVYLVSDRCLGEDRFTTTYYDCNGNIICEIAQPGSNSCTDIFQPTDCVLLQDCNIANSPNTPLVTLSSVPNPFTNSTTIQFTLPEAGQATLNIFDTNGETVFTVTQAFEAGQNQINWNAESSGYGLYYYRLQTDKAVVTKSMIMMER